MKSDCLLWPDLRVLRGLPCTEQAGPLLYKRHNFDSYPVCLLIPSPTSSSTQSTRRVLNLTMKSFTQLVVLASSLAMVTAKTAKTIPQLSIEACPTCADPDCSTSDYYSHVELEEVGKALGDIRTFQTETDPGVAANLVASFMDSSSVRKSTSSGIITSRYDDAVVVSVKVHLEDARINDEPVDFNDKVTVKVAPGTTCSITLPGSYQSKDVKEVDLFMNEKKE